MMGIAYVLLENDEKIHSYYEGISEGTNNRAEILAAMYAIKHCKENNIKEVTIFTDSMYLIGCVSKGWKRNKNQDLWIKMDDAIQGINISWEHVKGHNGDRWNSYVDMLAQHASNI
jgi:ribonuclease HI